MPLQPGKIGWGDPLKITPGPAQQIYGPDQDPNQVNAAFPEYGLNLTSPGSFNIPGVVAPTTNPNLQAILNRQAQQANDYQKNLPGYITQAQNSYATQAKQGLADTIKNTRANYNARGMLRSGGRQSAEMGAKYQTGFNIKQANPQIAQGLINQGDQMENNAFNTAGNLAGLGAGLGTTALGGPAQQVSNQVASGNASQAIAGGFGSGLGSLAGAITANNKKNGLVQQPNYANYGGGSGGGLPYDMAGNY